MTLHLTLKKKWFDMTKAKIKREEYREIKKYWQRRLYSCGIKPGKYGKNIDSGMGCKICIN